MKHRDLSLLSNALAAPMAFLSYAHVDDHEGEVTRFVDRLKREITQQTGREFDVFRDRADLKWGETWRRRIDESLDSVTFLIAVLSPSFFQSAECMRELERFRARERQLGRDDLILPIVWIEPDELSDEGHQLGVFLRQRQYKSWEEFRFHEKYPVEAHKQIVTLARDVKAAIRRAPAPNKAGEEPPMKVPATKQGAERPAKTERATSSAPTPISTDGRPGTPEAKSLVEELQDAATSHRRRKEIGGILAEIGDPRSGVGVIDGVPDVLWRAIPGGEVEIEGHGRFSVQPFQMAAYPVTNAQFEAFLNAQDGYINDRWWKGLSVDREHRSPEEPHWKQPNHPRVYVSWYEAMAFCSWLSDKLGVSVGLPGEPEWQWAAQSAQTNFAYPWGPTWRDGVANTSKSGVRRPIAVGMYLKAGDSLQEVSDLAGNVWEWCRNEYSDPERTQRDSTEPRALRGGSWYSVQDLARADCRGYFHPGVREGSIGFRVVCSAPIL